MEEPQYQQAPPVPQVVYVQQPRRRYSIGSILLLIVLVGVLVSLYVFLRTGKPPAIVQQAAQQVEEAAAPAPINIVSERMSVDASGGSQMRGFTLNRQAPVRVEVTGLRDTAKGFDVYVIKQEEWANLRDGREFRHIPAFEGLKVTRMSETHDLPPGNWAVVVRNSYNLLNSMEVELKVTAHPAKP